MPINLIIMGVSGVGKSTIGKALSEKTGWSFIEGDHFHPPENVDKQASGIPLENADRVAWIAGLVDAANELNSSDPTIISCSALNEFVRSRLVLGCRRACKFVWLDLPVDKLNSRLAVRKDHFMPANLLASQLRALDPPTDALHIQAQQSVEDICAEILKDLNYWSSSHDTG